LAGLDAAAARGRKGGRPKALDATKIDATHRLLDSGMPVKDVAATLDVGISTLYRYGVTGPEARLPVGMGPDPA
jgi:DNA invertase Pin-like site-specific DNA recombinase